MNLKFRRLPTLQSWVLAAAFITIVIAALVSPAALFAQANGRVPPATPAGASDAEIAGQQAAAAQAAAAESEVSTNNLLKLFLDGGILMYPIALCSVLLLIFVFERTISLRRGRVIPGPFVKRFLEQVSEGQIDRDEALALCEKNNSPTAEVFAAAVRKWGRSSVEVEQAIIDSGERVTNGLRSYLRLINGIATVAPLLGLLGTVVGMLHAFNGLDAAVLQSRAGTLASGISTALITTAAGLCVAIPAIIAYLFFVGRVDRLIIEIDSLGQELVSAIASDGIPSPTRRTSTGKKKRGTDGDSNRGAA
jgi:biopolymer transport protein ExbB